MRGWRSPKIAKALLAHDDHYMLVDSQVGFELGGLDGVGRDDWSFDEAGYRAAFRKGEGMAKTRSLLAKHPRLFWSLHTHDGGPRWPWMKEELQRRYVVRDYGSFDAILGQLATWDDTARTEYWSIMRAGRYLWFDNSGWTHALTLGFDFATIPHWAEELESNCCRIAGRVAGGIEDLFLGIIDLYGCADYGIGQPGSRRVRTWFELYGGDPRWSRAARCFIPEPE